MKRTGWLAFAFLSIPLLVLFVFYSLGSQKRVTEPAPHRHIKAPAALTRGARAATGSEVRQTEAAAPGDVATRKKRTRLLGQEAIKAAFAEAVALKDTDPVLAQEKIHAIARELGGGDPDWTEFLHLRGHGLITTVPGLEGTYQSLDDAVRYYELHLQLFGENEAVQKELEGTRAALQWNEDIAEVQRLAQPIKDVERWIEENAPSEWEIVEKHYVQMLKERTLPGDPREDWRTPSERADIHYEAFFDALEFLPDDSQTLGVLFENDVLRAKETFLSEKIAIEAEPRSASELAPVHAVDVHTVDLKHAPASVSQSSPVSSPGDSTSFNSAVMDYVQRFGSEEGLRRLSESDSEWQVQIEARFPTKEAFTEWRRGQSSGLQAVPPGAADHSHDH